MERKVVTVVGATGKLGLEIVKALLAQGAYVRAMVRSTSNRSKLEALGVTDFVIGDMLDAKSLKTALLQKPLADAIVACAAGYTRHSKGDSTKTDTQGYRNLVDASKEAEIPRFILISILECDKATSVPHFYNKYLIEEYLKEKKQPFIALRPGAFLDQAQDMIPNKLKKGIYPAFFHGSFGMVYTPDLARYVALAATKLPDSVLGRLIDIGWETAASGSLIAQAFSKALGRPIEAEPAIPPFVTKLVFPILGLFNENIRDMSAMIKWVETGVYVSHAPQIQKELFGELPTVDEAVMRYCRDRGLT